MPLSVLRSQDDSANYRINNAVKYECRQGFCAEVFSTVVFPDGTSRTSYVTEGTNYFRNLECSVEAEEENTFSSPQIISNVSSVAESIIVEGLPITSFSYIIPLCIMVAIFLTSTIILFILYLKTKRKIEGHKTVIQMRYNGGKNEKKIN